MIRKILYFVGLAFFSVFLSLGISFAALLAHEGVHYLQFKEPIKICSEFGTGAIAAVYGYNGGEKISEVPAYTVQFVVSIILGVVSIFLFVFLLQFFKYDLVFKNREALPRKYIKS